MQERSKRPHEWRKPAGGRCSRASRFIHPFSFILLLKILFLLPFLLLAFSLASFFYLSMLKTSFLSFDLFCLMKFSNVQSLLQRTTFYNKIFCTGLDLKCIMHTRLPKFLRRKTKLSEQELLLCVVNIRIRSPLQPSCFVKNWKSKIDSRRRYKLYKIYWRKRS